MNPGERKTTSAEDDILFCFVADPWHFSKVEVLFSRPLVVLFHQILTPAWANDIINAAKPELTAPKTVSTKSGTVKSAAQKRSGQVAFVTGSFEDDAEKVTSQFAETF